MAASPASIRWRTFSASRIFNAATASVRGERLRAGEVELDRLPGLAGTDVDGERRAGRTLEEDCFVLDALGAEHEAGERLVDHNLLAGDGRLGEVDRRSCVSGREVLVAREDEVEHDAGRGVAARRAASRRVDERRSADEIRRTACRCAREKRKP